MDTVAPTVTLYSPGNGLEARADDVWNLLAGANDDFVPPLSSRRGTTEVDLVQRSIWGAPVAYFETVMTQFVLIADIDDQAVGLSTFIPHYDHPLLANYSTSTYCTTTVVNARFRRRGIAYALNDALESLPHHLASPWITRRTWSTNISNIELLLQRGFKEVVRLPDDRGPGVDTIYLARRTDPTDPEAAL